MISGQRAIDGPRETDLLHWPPPPPADKRGGEMAERSQAEIPAWHRETVIDGV